MKPPARQFIVFFVFASIVFTTAAYADEEAYRDCIAFYGVPVGHPKRQEVQIACRDVTRTMAEWKMLKEALCASTPQDEKCKEFRTK